jgi:hypothetical protein
MRNWSEQVNRRSAEARERFEATADELAPLMRKSCDRFSRLMDEQAQRGVHLVRETFDPAVPANPSEAMDRMATLWRTSFDCMRDGAEALTRAQSDMFSHWSDYVKARTSGSAEPVATKRAAAAK